MKNCLCGCGTLTKSTFAPGHDTRFKALLRSGQPLSAAQLDYLREKAFAATVDSHELARVVEDALRRVGGSLRSSAPEPVAAPAPATQLDEKLLRKLIDSAVEKAVRPYTTTIEVKTPEKTRRVDGGHFYLDRVIKLLGAGFNVYLWGPAGTGKTTAAQMAVKALGRESEIDTLDPSTFRSMVQGFTTATKGEPVHTSFTRCWTEGKVYIADEVDNAPGHVQTLFNSALANGHAPLAWGNAEKAKGFAFCGTGNTPGRPTRAFPDRKPMSAAFADRLYFVYWPLDPAIECRAVGLPAPALPQEKRSTCGPQQWVKFVQALRSWASENAPTLQVTPRASLAGVQALALGESAENVAEGLIFRGCDAELKTKALNAVRWEVAA